MIELIPAIDIQNGKCVRLEGGDFARSTIYSDDPVNVARRFEEAGCRRLHLVDLDGARAGSPVNLAILERVAHSTSLQIDFGGGVKSDPDLESVFSAGAAIANVGSVAVRDPELLFSWIDLYGSAILPGVDVLDGKIRIDGWQTATEIDAVAKIAELSHAGAAAVFATDISRDGLLAGPSIELYRKIAGKVPDIRLIASGGVRSFADMLELESTGCAAVIVGKAIYEGSISLKEVTAYAR